MRAAIISVGFAMAGISNVSAAAEAAKGAAVASPDGRNRLELLTEGKPGVLRYRVLRDGREVVEPSRLGPAIPGSGPLADGAAVAGVETGSVDETFDLLWGKTKTVRDHCTTARATIRGPEEVRWQIEMRAYNDGVAFRYALPASGAHSDLRIEDEATEFNLAGDPVALATGYDNFTTSHEAPFQRTAISEIPARKLLDMPLLVTWPDGAAAAITEAGIRGFAGMYLQRAQQPPSVLRARLSPSPEHNGIAVAGTRPLESPWRVVLLADSAGQMLESSLLLCLNDSPPPKLGDFTWLKPGKTSFHWWSGEFEKDYKSNDGGAAHLARHKRYIDFCRQNNIAYHGVSGDGRPWHFQSQGGYGNPGPDADVRKPRPEIHLPEILEYAKSQDIGIRLWVHWQPLSKHLEEAFALYNKWGVKGLMVDFLNRDDQQMNQWAESMLQCAARNKLHIQIHGSPKYSGEQRTFPNLFNREGVMNLEYLKWSDRVTPQHNVDVAYTRALAGPVDYHLGGFQSASRTEFKPRDRLPLVLGTRCHHLALYVVYENPMPMIADAPARYEGQPGLDLLRRVPVTWDETRFLAGEPGEFVVLARRSGATWYVAGISNWTPRELAVSLERLSPGPLRATVYSDGSMDEQRPNEVAVEQREIAQNEPLAIRMAPGGGFVAEVTEANRQ